MSAMEGLVGDKKKKTIKEKIGQSMQAVALAGGLSAGAGAVEAHAQTMMQIDTTTKDLWDLAAGKSYLPKGEYEQIKKEKENKSPQMTFKVALLAHAKDPDYGSFDEDTDLAFVGQVKPSLVYPLVKNMRLGPNHWDGLQKEFEVTDEFLDQVEGKKIKTASVKLDILKDLSAQLKDLNPEFDGIDPIAVEEARALIARNLSMIGKMPTDENVKAEVENVLKRRAEVGSHDILQQNVLLISGDEVLGPLTGHDGEIRFGKKALQDEIRARHRSSPTKLQLITVDPFATDTAPYYSTEKSSAQAKSDALAFIETSLDPLTVYFDGHGNPDAWGLGHRIDAQGRVVSGINDQISVSELADALAKRYEAEQKANHQDLQIAFVSSACYMQNFARNLAEILRARNIPVPGLTMSSSEYGQPGISEWDNKFGARFNEVIATSPDLESAMRHKHSVKDSSPTTFVPRPNDPKHLMQISGIVLASFPKIG